MAELEHEQWMRWSNYLVTNYDMPSEIIVKWEKDWIPYNKLTESQKDKDRIWADKVIKIFLDSLPKEKNKPRFNEYDLIDNGFNDCLSEIKERINDRKT